MYTATDTHGPMEEAIHPVARLSWRAILAGAIASLSITWLLLSLGGAVGLTAMEPRHYFGNPRGAAGFGVWMVIAVAIGSFVGGLISVRASSIVDRADAMIQGLTTWALGFLFSAVFAAFLATIGSVGAFAGPMGNAGPGATGRSEAQAAEQAVQTGAGASWVVFASGLVGAIAAVAGGAAGLRQRESGRGVPIGRPTEPATVS